MSNAEIPTGLYWKDKRTEVDRVDLPFQTIETINESRASREKQKEKSRGLVFEEQGKYQNNWYNRLIWGDNKYIMSSLLKEFAGKIDLIYIDPPFATGADFSVKMEIGDIEWTKEPSAIEDKAYRDTWGSGIDSYLQMMYDRLVLLRQLLAETGSIFVHIDVHIGPYIKIILDEIFGKKNFQNEIAWYYYNKLHGSRKRCIPKAFDQILYYLKNSESNFTYNTLSEKRDQPVKKLKYHFINGKIVNDKDEEGKTITYESTERQIDNVWRIRCLQPANKEEWVNFNTQKPVDLIERILSIASKENDLILDAFCGSGSSLIAAERQNRRWIGCDLSRYSIHLSRKRLLDEENCNPFIVQNLGKYERQYWQGITFKKKNNEQIPLYEYIEFILRLYNAEPLTGLLNIHGKKGKRLVHIGAVDAPVTLSEIKETIEEVKKLGQDSLDILGWEWEMGLHDVVENESRESGVKLRLFYIPRDVMDTRAVESEEITFYELAYLETDVEETKSGIKVKLKDFAIPNLDLIPEEVRSKIKKWSDYIDYWAVDWDWGKEDKDTFHNMWQSYRTRKERTLELKTDAHIYEEKGKHQVMVKVIDIFGNDTTRVLEVKA